MIQSKVLETFVNERIEEHIREICRDNADYRAVGSELGLLTDKVCDYIDTLPEAAREVFERYSEVRDKETYMQNQYMYLSGIRDTLLFLKALDVLEDEK